MSIVTGILNDYPLGSEALRTDGSAGQSDTVDLATPAVALLLNTAGTIKVLTTTGQTRAFASGELALGVWHPMQIRRVYATDTALTDAQYRLGYGRY